MILVGLPVDLGGSDQPYAGLGLAIRASIVGLRVQSFNDTPLAKKINIRVSFPKGTEYESFRVETEIVWKDVHSWEGWEEYHYALKFFKILKDHYLKFKRLFCRPSGAEGASAQTHHRGVSV